MKAKNEISLSECIKFAEFFSAYGRNHRFAELCSASRVSEKLYAVLIDKWQKKDSSYSSSMVLTKEGWSDDRNSWGEPDVCSDDIWMSSDDVSKWCFTRVTGPSYTDEYGFGDYFKVEISDLERFEFASTLYRGSFNTSFEHMANIYTNLIENGNLDRLATFMVDSGCADVIGSIDAWLSGMQESFTDFMDEEQLTEEYAYRDCLKGAFAIMCYLHGKEYPKVLSDYDTELTESVIDTIENDFICLRTYGSDLPIFVKEAMISCLFGFYGKQECMTPTMYAFTSKTMKDYKLERDETYPRVGLTDALLAFLECPLGVKMDPYAGEDYAFARNIPMEVAAGLPGPYDADPAWFVGGYTDTCYVGTYFYMPWATETGKFFFIARRCFDKLFDEMMEWKAQKDSQKVISVA